MVFVGGGDQQIRIAAFRFLDDLRLRFGDALPWSELSAGFEYGGRRIGLIGQRGIWKPAAMELPISIATSPNDPYGDRLGDDGYLSYRYYGSDPRHPDNVGLRRLMTDAVPLIYFHGIEKGVYAALWPALIVGDDPSAVTFTVACEDIQMLRPELPPSVIDDVRRAYTTTLAVRRLHQAAFRQRVLKAYERRCAVCALAHIELLDAAHIIGDLEESGDPVVPNGLAMCKIHHAAFDANIMGVRPDAVIEIRPDVLEEADGPMLRHGLQEHHGQLLHLPRSRRERPDRDRLELRYERFRRAG
jgi:putative restriction endonuclease